MNALNALVYNPPVHADPQLFQAAVTSLLDDKSAVLVVPAAHLLDGLTDRQLRRFFREAIPGKPNLTETVVASLPGLSTKASALTFALPLLKHSVNNIQHAHNVRKIANLCFALNIHRPVLSLTNAEKTLINGMAAVVACGDAKIGEWNRFLALIAYANAKNADLLPSDEMLNDPRLIEARAKFRDLVRLAIPDYEATLAAIGARIASAQQKAPHPPSVSLDKGARWMTIRELEEDGALTFKKTPASMLIGYSVEPTPRPVYFNGHESLISVGGPGSYKTTAQVVPNLLTFKGSAIVLDVKGELWELTAGRRSEFGPVYRFSPSNPEQRSDCYNPFDFISRDPDLANIECTILAQELIPINPNTRQPYFDNSARAYIAAIATAMVLYHERKNADFTQLAELLSINTSTDKPDAHAQGVIDLLRKVGSKHKLPNLLTAATALNSGFNSDDWFEAVIDIARKSLSRFTMGGLPKRATATSDWSPADLRSCTGTTVYLNIPTSDLEAFAPILRLMFYQHMRVLLRTQVRHDDVPITFFLDELPQLGNFRSILQLQETGRGSGLRLSMFVQNMGQLRDAYGVERGQSISQDARVRSYLKPDDHLADALSKRLGETRNIFTGEREPLATPQQLAGPEFIGKMVVIASESHPVVLYRKRWFEIPELKALVRRPPPVKRLW